MKRHCLFLIATTAAVHAGDRTSANYAVTADDAAASAGQRSTSANYTADQSVADSGIVVSSANYDVRQGYTGQLLDPAWLSLTATPSPVSETATSQLTAALVHDDGTRSPVSSSAVTWSIVNGPARSVSAAGVFTADVVYVPTSAVVRGIWGSFSAFADITVQNTSNDNYHNYAGDGIPDWWQIVFFDPDNPAGEAGADPDADGQDNLFEYLAGNSPTDPRSLFDITLTTAGSASMDIGFGPLAVNRWYLLEVSADMMRWEKILEPRLISDNGIWRVLRDESATGTRRFYRITIGLE